MFFLFLPVLLFPTASDDLTQAELETMSRDVLGEIEELRGDQFTRDVKVSIADKAGFLKYADDRVERTTTENQLRSDEIVMKLLGLIEPEMDYMATTMELLEDQVGGFYDPGTESFFLMSSFQGGLAKIILAHELTHALDDQLFDIDGTLNSLAGNTDAQMAYHAVVEGSGTSTMNQWTMRNINKSISLKDLASSSAMDTSGLKEAPAALWKPMLMVYMRGAAFLNRSDNVGVGQTGAVDRADLERAFTKPPSSTEQILHPDKYWDADSFDEPVEVTIDASSLEMDGWEVVNQQTLGEATLALLTSDENERGGLDASNPFKLLATKYTNEAAAGWGGDRYVLLEKDGMVFLHLATLWDSDKDAVEFHANVSAQWEGLIAAHGRMPSGGSRAALLAVASKRVELSVLLGADVDTTPEAILKGLIRKLKVSTRLAPLIPD